MKLKLNLIPFNYFVFLLLLFFVNNINGQLLTSFNLPKLPILDRSEPQNYQGNPLILTPLLKSGDSAKARKLSEVDNGKFLNVLSYSGYFTVDEKFNSNSFFWFFPAKGTEDLYRNSTNDKNVLEQIREEHKNKPVVLWLQGGPGVSSLFALFTENGPFFVSDDGKSIRENPWSWHNNYSVLFIDNPVGTGYSFTEPGGYCTNITQIAKHLVKALKQFFQLFPFLKENDFFVTGESFAGKYIPALGYEIFKQGNTGINLKGLALGNAFSDPYNMIDYSDFAYQLGLIGLKGYQEMKITEAQLRLNYGDLIKAKQYWDYTLGTFSRNSNYSNLYNIQDPRSMDLYSYYEFVTEPEIRRALHVGSTPFSGTNEVYKHLLGDFVTTAIHWIEYLLDNSDIRIMYYNGNWDFIVAYPLSANAFKRMKWSGADEYRTTAARKSLIVNGQLKGYITKARNFAEVAILNAGHMVPTDQPEACLEMIDRFFRNEL